jgi:hypothetical protein
LRSALGRRAGLPFRRDERGGTAVQAIVFLPVILFSMVVMMYVVETITIRNSLHTGTYLATRYLSLYVPDTIDTYHWAEVAKKFIYAEMKNNPFVDTTRLGDVDSPVTVTLMNGNECNADFFIEARYRLWLPLQDTATDFLPGVRQLDLVENRRGKVLCGERGRR